MGLSAPDITAVSKPNKKPASAAATEAEKREDVFKMVRLVYYYHKYSIQYLSINNIYT